MNENERVAMANGATEESRKRRQTWWNVREAICSLHGVEVAKKYDQYLKEHKNRLCQLYALAGCDSGMGRDGV